VLSFLRHQDKLGFICTLPVPFVTHDIDVYDQMSQVDLIRIDFEICQLSYTYDPEIIRACNFKRDTSCVYSTQTKYKIDRLRLKSLMHLIKLIKLWLTYIVFCIDAST
jgi:hypothetical protein